MPRRRWIAFGGLLVAGAALAVAPATELEIENPAAGRSARVRLRDERFAVTYQHSMYDRPVTEEFTRGPGDTIQLLTVSSPSAAVREYFGITAIGETHAVNRSFHELVFRVAAGPEQRLRTGSAERSFLDFGDHGDRLVVHVRRAPVVKLLLSRHTTRR